MSHRSDTPQSDAVGLIELRHRAGMLDHSLNSRVGIDTMLIETLAELLTLCRMLPADTQAIVRLRLAEACEHNAAAYERDDPSLLDPCRLDDTQLASLSAQARPVVVALADALSRLAAGIAQRRRAAEQPPHPAAKAAFVADAFSNPAHARFALKTTIAVMASYIIYSGLDWPGISTAITTCFFVALGSLGETVHKLTLRILGATIGGLAGGLCIVFVLPALTDIGQLCLLIVAVSAVCAWVSTSSDRLAYAGMQTAFAFFLGVLQTYGPATDLTVLRDRVVGILLGNLLMSLVFSVLWPTGSVDRARASLATVLRTLGQLLVDQAASRTGRRLAAVRALDDVRRYIAISAFELHLLPSQPPTQRIDGWSLDSLDRLVGGVFVVIGQSEPEPPELLRHHDTAVSAWFTQSADRLGHGQGAAPLAAEVANARLALPPPTAGSTSRRAAVEARLLLQSEIEHAVAATA